MRIRSVVVTAALIALAFVVYMAWSRHWNYPAGQDMTTSASIDWSGEEIPVNVTCMACPIRLVVGQQRTLQFRFRLGPTERDLFDKKKIDVWYEVDGPARSDASSAAMWLVRDAVRKTEWKGDFSATVTALDESVTGLVFHLTVYDLGADAKTSEDWTEVGMVHIPVHTAPSAFQVIAPYLYATFLFLLFAGAIFMVQRQLAKVRGEAARTIAQAQLKAAEHPEKMKFTWELAQVKLEAYFDRNLVQVNLVFWVAVFVMIVGFAFVLTGIVLSFGAPKIWTTPLVAAVSGIITQFIGATFMVIYRSTMAQANKYMAILEKINSVGMAVHVVDSLQNATELQNETRAAMAQLLLGGKTNLARPAQGNGYQRLPGIDTSGNTPDGVLREGAVPH